MVTVRESSKVNKGLGEEGGDTPIGQAGHKAENTAPINKKSEEKKDNEGREVKKWMIPQGYCL